jgi:hypothetical protein
MSLATSLDIFTFWQIALTGIGFSAVSPKKVSIGKGIAIVAIVWLLYIGAKVAWAAAFS